MNTYCSAIKILTATIPMLFSQALFSQPEESEKFNAYPGYYAASLVSVEAGNIVNLKVDVWAGFPRVLRITLPDVAVPVDHADAPACQAEMVEQARAYTETLLSAAQRIQVQNITMENTGAVDADSAINTDQGKLSAALLEQGLGRSISTDPLIPWC